MHAHTSHTYARRTSGEFAVLISSFAPYDCGVYEYLLAKHCSPPCTKQHKYSTNNNKNTHAHETGRDDETHLRHVSRARDTYVTHAIHCRAHAISDNHLCVFFFWVRRSCRAALPFLVRRHRAVLVSFERVARIHATHTHTHQRRRPPKWVPSTIWGVCVCMCVYPP